MDGDEQSTVAWHGMALVWSFSIDWSESIELFLCIIKGPEDLWGRFFYIPIPSVASGVG
jgi:hypothetical protein